MRTGSHTATDHRDPENSRRLREGLQIVLNSIEAVAAGVPSTVHGCNREAYLDPCGTHSCAHLVNLPS